MRQLSPQEWRIAGNRGLGVASTDDHRPEWPAERQSIFTGVPCARSAL